MKEKNPRFSETVLLQGHIIDSLTFSEVFWTASWSRARASRLKISASGKRKTSAATRACMCEAGLSKQKSWIRYFFKGTAQSWSRSVWKKMMSAYRARSKTACFPDGFYCTTNLETWIRWKSGWIKMSAGGNGIQAFVLMPEPAAASLFDSRR